MRKTERRLAIVVAPLVLTAVALPLYMAHGPFGTEPVVIRTSLLPDAIQGRYLGALPDFIFVQPDANATTVAHETLHYEHPDWTECEVSATLAAQGMHDSYYRTGECDQQLPKRRETSGTGWQPTRR